ncbi:hypothetical protein [Umezakia ovalisporum]|uniref:hypothetical protein n=1 Tax=Umezakia ovalisporum TaxID=75695 RepID=UPI002475D215|nr:hypothetical protein [Umezakia ovalisporum]MDH6069004.1 hypothetical protein [Umezakia ovalisporum APH033B]MDH6102941.1 hypothetical protein [Umezakia ovalisporum ANA283AFssAo]
MRIYLYILAGLTSALIGWNVGQFFLTDLGLLPQFPEIALFPCIAISLAVGMVMNEIFISNPTRYKLNLRTAKIPLLISLGLGTMAGLIAGTISQILFLPIISVPSPIVRTFSWLLIGFSVGIAEGLSWRWHTIEAGDPKRFRQRLITSCAGASGASLVAAVLFELIRMALSQVPTGLRNIEDPLGVSILGMLLGLVFSITNSPSYVGALRAGTGFEYTGFNYDYDQLQLEDLKKKSPYIDKSILRFVSDGETDEIEEGLSIQLPTIGTIEIGCDVEKSHIYLPGLAPQMAKLVVNNREVYLVPTQQFISFIEINGYRLVSAKPTLLKHNYLLTFHTVNIDGNHEEKIYRFVYYNRFLDPQA